MSRGEDGIGREGPLEGRLRLRHFTPLAGFVVPTVLIGYGVVIPRSCIAGIQRSNRGNKNDYPI